MNIFGYLANAPVAVVIPVPKVKMLISLSSTSGCCLIKFIIAIKSSCDFKPPFER